MVDFAELARRRREELTGVPEPVAPQPQLIPTTEAEAGGIQLNIGISETLGLPVDIVTSVLNAAAALPQLAMGRRPSRIEPAIQRPVFGGEQLTETLRQFEPPETTTGRVAGRAARFLGGSVAGLGGVAAGSRQIAQQIARAPKTALAAEAVSAGGAGVLGEAAAAIDPSLGPIGELAGGLTPFAVNAAIRRAALSEQRRLSVPERLRGAQEQELAARGAEEALGAEGTLLPAQKAAEPFLLETQSFLAQLPEGSQIAAKALKKQNQKAFALANRVVNEIAAPEVVSTAGARFATASKKAVALEKTAREEAASPVFNQAFNEAKTIKLRVDVTPVQDEFARLADEFTPDTGIGKVVESVRKAVSSSADRGLSRTAGVVTETVTGSNLLPLHGAKTDLDRKIAKAVKEGDSQLLRVLMGIKEKLTTSMTDSSVLYRQAEETFALASPPVDEIVQSVIGRAAVLEGDRVPRLAEQVFSPATQNPTTIKQTKQIIEGIDPGAWKALVRSEMERRFGAISQELAETGVLAVENVPKQLQRAIFGTTKQRANILAAVDGKTRENLLFLEAILKRAGLGRPGGSQTGIRGEIATRLRSIGNKLRVLAQPLQAISARGERALDEGVVREQARIFFDPDGFNASLATFKGNPSDPRVINRTLAALDEAIGE